MVCQDGVTIAVPNWNHELFLPRSIESGLRAARHCREHGFQAEVLVIDDGSRDGSMSLLRTLEALYADDGLRVHRHEANAGLAATRNTALVRARHRYIVLMDADNELVAANLPLFLQTLRETGAAGAYGNLLLRKLGHETAWRVCSNESIQTRIFNMNYVDAFALFDRHQLLDVGGYRGALPAWEDWEMWLHLITSGRRVVFVPLAFGTYYELPHSMIRTHENADYLLSRCQRMFNQVGARDEVSLNASLLRYFPGVGYL